jgi:hypothetical protein
MRKCLGENATKTVSGKFNREVMKKEFKDIIERVL